VRCEPVLLLSELTSFGSGIVCLVGGGGKTSLLYALGADIANNCGSALLTSTTKMFRPDLTPDFPQQVSVALEHDPTALPPCRGVVFAARPASDDGKKVHGYSADEVDALFSRAIAPTIIVEADGASCRPIKAPASHEPVIPANTTIVIGVIGLSCFSMPFTPATVFRDEYFAAVTGLTLGDTLTPEAVAALVLHPKGLFKNRPRIAKRLLFLNQCDLPGALDKGAALAEMIFTRAADFLHAVYIGSVNKERTSCHKVLSD